MRIGIKKSVPENIWLSNSPVPPVSLEQGACFSALNPPQQLLKVGTSAAQGSVSAEAAGKSPAAGQSLASALYKCGFVADSDVVWK